MTTVRKSGAHGQRVYADWPDPEWSDAELDAWANAFVQRVIQAGLEIGDGGSETELIDPFGGPDEPDPEFNPDPQADVPPYGAEV